MAAPHPRLRKQLSAPGLLKTIRQRFEKVPEHRHERSEIPLPDALMAGLAVFGLGVTLKLLPPRLSFFGAWGTKLLAWGDAQVSGKWSPILATRGRSGRFATTPGM